MSTNEDRTDNIIRTMNEYQSREWAEAYGRVRELVENEAVFDDEKETEKLISDIKRTRCDTKKERGYF